MNHSWRFRAENVRDFAFASSRKFIWDAQMAPSGGKQVLAMSFYPKEAEPLWSQYSTASIAHTIDVYSRYTFEYMTSGNAVPIMTNSDSLLQFGNNAYGKPATALNILRESILGRELFDFAFAEFANRWKFKRPTPADFFRTMEDASGIDLDWFWRGWFYGTDYVDVAIVDLALFTVDTRDPD